MHNHNNQLRGESERSQEKSLARRHALFLLLVFLSLFVGILIAGDSYYQSYEARFRTEAETRLRVIAELKVSELVQWRQERLVDARILYRNPAFSDLVRQALATPGDPAAVRQVNTWLRQLQINLHYDRVRLMDERGVERYSSPATPSARSAYLQGLLREPLTGREPFLSDLYRHEGDGRIYLAAIVPILDETHDQRLLGVMTLRVDAEQYLYPLLRRWPWASETGETLLVRRDGDSALFLNNLRFDSEAALRLKIPFDRTGVPAVRAVLGEKGVVEGPDYRGKQVLAALHQVGDSSWFMVARVDRDEILAPLKTQLHLLIALLIALVACAGAVTGLFWRWQRARFYRQKYAAAREQAWLRDVIDKSLNEIYVFDPQSLEFIYVNEGACTNLGHAREKLLGMTPAEIMPEYNEGQLRAKLQPLLSGEQQQLVFETLYRRHTGTEYPAFVHLQYVVSGLRPKFLAVVVDATELRHKERDLAQRNVELERINYTLSHDLRSPLVTIRTFLSYVRKDLDKTVPGQFVQEFDFMTKAADRMGCLLDDLLRLSAVGRVINPPELTSFQAVVREAVAMTSGHAKESGVQVRIGNEELALLGDRLRLVELWQNLVDNAIKSTDKVSTPLVEIGIEGEGRNAVFFVRDNGIGIAPRFHKKVFGWFEKLDPASAGTGLGLPLVKRIIETHGGKIWIESAGDGQGCCFRFTLTDAVVPSGKGE